MTPNELNFQIRIRFSPPGAPSVERVISVIPCRIGRGSDNDIDLGDGSVSSNHALLEWDPGATRFILKDLGSRNGIRKTADGGLLKSSSVALGLGSTQFVLGVVSIELEIVELAAQQTATVDVGSEAQKRIPHVTGSQSFPSVRVIAGMASSEGPKGALRSIKMREPTGGIRIDRSNLRQVNARFNISHGQQGLRFSRAGQGLDGRGGSGSARRRTMGLFWPGSLILVLSSIVSSKTLMEGELGTLIPESMDPYIIGVLAFLLVAVLLCGSLFVASIRFLFKRGDISFTLLVAQVFGAFALANGAALLFQALARHLSISGEGLAVNGINAFSSALYWLFGVHGLMLLRSRASSAGSFARYSPWTAASLAFLVALALPGVFKGLGQNGQGEGVALLRQTPQVPPFLSQEESEARNPAALPNAEQAVMEFTVASQALDEKLARKPKRLKDSLD